MISAATYDLPLPAVHAGMAYYYDHWSEIDQSIKEDRAFAEAFRQNNPSPLKEKLEALARGSGASGFIWTKTSIR